MGSPSQLSQDFSDRDLSRSANQSRRFKRGAIELAVCGALLPLVAVPTAGAAAVPPVPSPATVLTIFPWEGSMEDELQGSLCQSPNNCVPIDQFLWDPNGIATIETTIDTTPGTKVVFSYSEGARSVADWMQEHADDPDAPSPDELSFVVIGNPTRAYGGSDRQVMPETQYQVIDISRQYDTASDFPDNPFNLLALLNSLAAFTVIHTDYEDVDMHDPANIVWKEGNTTYVFVPTENLPLLEPLRRLGLTDLADALNGPLKEIVERGYDRSYLPTDEEEPPSLPGLSAPLVSDQAEQDAVRASRMPETADPAPSSAEPKSGQQDVDRNNTGATDAVAATSPSDGTDDADVEAPPTSGSRESDENRDDADETAEATAASDTEQESEAASSRKRVRVGADTDVATTKGEDRDGSSSGADSDKAADSDKTADSDSD